MRIVELHLENYRGVTAATIAFSPTGVTIVEGDNEAGKTSLTQALDLVLNVRDDSKAQAVKDSQPIGRDVGPEVRVVAWSACLRPRRHGQEEGVEEVESAYPHP